MVILLSFSTVQLRCLEYEYANKKDGSQYGPTDVSLVGNYLCYCSSDTQIPTENYWVTESILQPTVLLQVNQKMWEVSRAR